MKNIVIVGGGISGLAAAYQAQEHLIAKRTPLACTLIDDQSRLGGKILTERQDGFIIEAGPDSFITQKPWGIELCKKLGLTDRLIPTNQAQKSIYVFSEGKLHPIPEGLVLMVPTRMVPFLKSPLISPLGKLRMAMDLFLPARKEAGDESLASFGLRRLGQEALDKLVEPLMAGIYVGRAETLSLDSTFPRFKELEKQYGSLIRGLLSKRRETAASAKAGEWTLFMTLQGGLSELVEALASKLNRIQVTTGKRVSTIHPPGKDNGSYTVRLEDGSSITADAVILTPPAFVTAGLVEAMDPSIATALREIPYVSTATISLAYKRSELSHPLDGYGFVVARNEGRKIMACTWTSTKFPHRSPKNHALIRCFVGGEGQESLVEMDDRAMEALVREELKIMMGIQATPVLTRIYRWKKANPLYTVGHTDRLARIQDRLKHHPGLFLTGSAYYGVGIPDCIHQGTLTAQQALKFLNA